MVTPSEEKLSRFGALIVAAVTMALAPAPPWKVLSCPHNSGVECCFLEE